jgi:hypothetical protein
MTRVLILLLLSGVMVFGQTARRHNDTERRQGYFDMAIPEGGNLSAGIIVGGRCLVNAIQTPATLTATKLTFQFSADGTTFSEVKDDIGAFYEVTVGTSSFILVDPGKWFNVRAFKVRTGTAASPTTEAAERTLRFLCGS